MFISRIWQLCSDGSSQNLGVIFDTLPHTLHLNPAVELVSFLFKHVQNCTATHCSSCRHLVRILAVGFWFVSLLLALASSLLLASSVSSTAARAMSPLAQNSPLTFRVIQGKSQSLLKLTSQKKKKLTSLTQSPAYSLYFSETVSGFLCEYISLLLPSDLCTFTFSTKASLASLLHCKPLIHISSLLHQILHTPLPCIIFKGTYDSLTYIFTHLFYYIGPGM